MSARGHFRHFPLVGFRSASAVARSVDGEKVPDPDIPDFGGARRGARSECDTLLICGCKPHPDLGDWHSNAAATLVGALEETGRCGWNGVDAGA
jgi:hypothetical protein